MHSSDRMLTVTNSTITGNSATSYGGGISGLLTATNSIIALNKASSNPDVADVFLPPESEFNLIGVDPLFVRNPSPGDPGDLHLLPGSPAINMGSNALAVDAAGSPLTTDLEGKDRVIYGTVDMGAYEYRLTGDANLDAVVDDHDASILARHWLQSGMTWAMGDFNSDGKVNDMDAAILAAHWGQQAPEAAELPTSARQLGEVPKRAALIGPRPASAVPVARRRLNDPREAAHDAALAQQYCPPTAPATLQRQRLAWVSAPARRQSHGRENRIRPSAPLAVDLLMADPET